MSSKVILVSGSAGFIGFHLSQKLLTLGHQVVGFDNMNDYYEVSLKESRLSILRKNKGFIFIKGDLKDKAAVDKVFSDYPFEYAVNLAAQAGVRYSIENPQAYLESNIQGFLNVL